jgi:hypothetical protein
MFTAHRVVNSLTLSLALSLCPATISNAQSSSGYASPAFTPQTITLGESITLENSPNCSPGAGEPSVEFYASTTPDTLGNEIAGLGYGEASGTWTPSAAGTYYIAEYVSANGATCNGLSSTPRYETLVVNP